MLWLNWCITDKASNTLKMSQEIRSSHAALFCKIDVLLKLPNFHRKASVMELLFGRIVSTHVCNCTKKDAITDVFLWTDFVTTIFLVHFIQASAGMFCKIVLLKNFGKLKRKHLRQSFFSRKSCTPSTLRLY